MDFLFSPLGIVVVVLVLALVGTGGALAARSAKAKKQLEASKAKQLEAVAGETGEKEADSAAAEPEAEVADQVKEAEVAAEESADAVAEEDAVAEPKATEPESPAAEASETPAQEEEVSPAAPEQESSPDALETPEPAQGRMQRLRSRLAKSGSFGKMLLGVLGRGDLSAEDWEEIEDTLLLADLGVAATDELMEELRTQAKVLGTSDPEKIREILRAKLIELVNPDLDRSLHLEQEDGSKPGIVLAVGVNGTGKTTTVGKIARILVAENQSVVLVDTAGRLQNKAGLMDELGKVKRVIEKSAPVTETLLVLDATTGQNGMQQAKVFSEVVDISGIVLTKLDGTARGGIVVSVQRELGVPVKLVGLGEGPDDLAPFVPEDFVDALLK